MGKVDNNIPKLKITVYNTRRKICFKNGGKRNGFAKHLLKCLLSLVHLEVLNLIAATFFLFGGNLAGTVFGLLAKKQL